MDYNFLVSCFNRVDLQLAVEVYALQYSSYVDAVDLLVMHNASAHSQM